MCISPIHIPNPNYGLDPAKNPLKNCTDVMIDVPCGYCSECIAIRQMYLVQRVQAESLKNHVFFCTLTYNNESMPIMKMPGGFNVRYADVYDVQCMLKRLRKSNVFGMPFRYFAVSELGTKRGRPHFHILFLFPKSYFDKRDYVVECNSFALEHKFDVLNEWRRNVGSIRCPKWLPLCTYVERIIGNRRKSNYDFHYVEPRLTDSGVNDVGFYVLKYMLKPSDRAVRLQRALRLNLDPVTYDSVWSIIKPRYFKSLGFGLNARYDVRNSSKTIDKDIYDKLKSDVKVSVAGKAKFPLFFKDDGSSWPLSPFYKKHWSNILTDDDRLKFHQLSNTQDSSELREHKTSSQILTSKLKYEKNLLFTDSGFDDELDFLFE